MRSHLTSETASVPITAGPIPRMNAFSTRSPFPKHGGREHHHETAEIADAAIAAPPRRELNRQMRGIRIGPGELTEGQPVMNSCGVSRLTTCS